jgi:hypothetical protein
MLAAAALCVVVAACESNAKFKEDLLSSAGFKPVTPKTPEQIASVRSLPMHKLTKTTWKGKTVWVYSDPTICGCLYIGNQAALDRYVQKQQQQRQLDMSNVYGPDTPANWDFTPWQEYGEAP